LVEGHMGKEEARLCREQGVSIEVDIRIEGLARASKGLQCNGYG